MPFDGPEREVPDRAVKFRAKLGQAGHHALAAPADGCDLGHAGARWPDCPLRRGGQDAGRKLPRPRRKEAERRLGCGDAEPQTKREAQRDEDHENHMNPPQEPAPELPAEQGDKQAERLLHAEAPGVDRWVVGRLRVELAILSRNQKLDSDRRAVMAAPAAGGTHPSDSPGPLFRHRYHPAAAL